MTTKNTHPLEVGYLVMGLIFLGLAGIWALREAQVVELEEMSWLLPLSLIVAGVVGLGAAAARNGARRRSTGEQSEPSPEEWTYDDERSL